MRYAMIMAGGAGTRLWPLSRPDRPKQLLRLIGDRSLLQLTAGRVSGLIEPGHLLVCTAERYREAVAAALPDVGDEQILGEPVARNTANAIGFTAAVLHQQDPDAIFAVLTADHVIEPEDELRRRLDTGYVLVESDPVRFVTFSITPDQAATAYGYVRRGAVVAGFEGAYESRGFVEKPGLEDAKRFVAGGDYGWNSGMFVFHAGHYLAAMRRFLPDAAAGLEKIAAAWPTEQRQAMLEATYPTLPSISVDYGVMEPAAADDAFKLTVVTMDVRWSDVGSWPAYGRTLTPGADGNRGNTTARHLDSRNMLCVSDDPDHLIATIGCEDLIIVHTADATLVCRASEAQRVKEISGG